LTERNPIEVMIERGTTLDMRQVVRLQARDGRLTPVEVQASLTRDDGDRIRGLALVFRDLTRLQAGELASRRLAAIVLTHHHVDHVGAAVFLASARRVPVWAHAATAALLPGVPVARTLAEGDAVAASALAPDGFRVLHTPGHAAGHLCLYEPGRGVAIVGDMVASVGTIVIDPDEGDMAAYLEQLRRLAALGARVALPSHGEPIDEPTAHFERYVAHRLRREDKVARAIAAAPGRRAEELVPAAYDDTPAALWPLAALSLRAHANKLVREGRAREEAGRLFPA
jgi:glyoxylase-like metal-dependent hydrolase (beta-lactamase superfamily II)